MNTKDLEKLNQKAKELMDRKYCQLGYPFVQNSGLTQYHQWIIDQGLTDLTLVNVGSPYKEKWDMLNTDEMERECVDFFAKAYHFSESYWGFVTSGGTDGNMHGIYFGRKFLQSKSKLPPIIYVSEEAHYSVKKIADVQNTEICIIKANKMGEMSPKDLEIKLNPDRPALIVYAIGGTFKGAIDQQEKLNQIVNKINPIVVYRHLDIALFGGYLPFLDDEKAREIINQSKMKFDSVAVSGHKFLSMNDPCGLFICTKKTFDSLQEIDVPYLNGSVPTISCSRSGFDPLKLYWHIHEMGVNGFTTQTRHALNMTDYLFNRMQELKIPAYKNNFSNTVFFKRPSEAVIQKYALANGVCEYFGETSHIVVMQYLNEKIIETFLNDYITLV